RLVRGGVRRHPNGSSAWLPWLLPRSYTVLEHIDDPISHLLAEVAFLWLRCRRIRGLRCRCHSYTSSPRTSSESKSGSVCSFSNPEPASGSAPRRSSAYCVWESN